MPKIRCVFSGFHSKFKISISIFKYADEVGKIFCTICKSVFSIGHSEHSDIKQHTTKVKKNTY